MRGHPVARPSGKPRIQTEKRCEECKKNPPMSHAKLCAGCRVKRDLKGFRYRP